LNKSSGHESSEAQSRFAVEWRPARHVGAIRLALPPNAFTASVREGEAAPELVLRFDKAAVAFRAGATAQLSGRGSSEPASCAVIDVPGGKALEASFALTDAMVGVHHLAVTDAAGAVYALDGALMVSAVVPDPADHAGHPAHAHHVAKPDSWFVKALLATLAGLMLSALITITIIALSAADFAPARVLERTGVDFGMQLYVYLIEPLAPPKSTQEYAFIDVDRDACMAFANQDGSACDSRTPVPPALVEDFVRAAGVAGAKVVLVDVAPPAKPEDRKALWTALAKPDGPWVIAPMYGRPGDDPLGLSLNGDPAQDIFPSRAHGRLRLAVAGTIDNDGDGIIRVYPTQFRVTEPDNRVDWFPSTPLLASQLANPAIAAQADCQFYGQSCSKGRRRAGPTPEPGRDDDPARYITGIFYSLPSLAVRHGRAQVNLERMYSRYYERYEASGLMQHGHFEPPGELLKDKIVIIATSRKQGFDWQVTPLGPMTGSEVVLNALRTFHDYAPLDRPLPKAPLDQKFSIGLNDFLTRFTGAAAGAFFMLGAWSLYHRLEELVPHRAHAAASEGGAGSRLGRMFKALPRNLVRLAIVFAGLAFAASVEIYLNARELDEIAAQLPDRQEFGHPIDVLAPLVALGLEAYADIAKGALAFFEALLAPVVHSVERLFLGIFGLVLRVGGKKT
jgi:hypothetical protein